MISNSTPLILLAKIARLEMLKKLFGYIIITNDVKEEVLIEDKSGYFQINEAIKNGWIKIENPKRNVELGLGKGENSAINLAKEKNDKLIIDDAFAVKAAKGLNIEFIRTTTVVFIAVEKGIINKKEAVSIINNLIENEYYIAPKYYAEILSRISF